MPKNLSVKVKRNISSKYDVTVSWAKPKLQPLFHHVQLIRVKPEAFNLANITLDGVS